MKANIEILDRGTAYERYPHLFEHGDEGGFEYCAWAEVIHGNTEDWVDHMALKFVVITSEDGRLLYFLDGDDARFMEAS